MRRSVLVRTPFCGDVYISAPEDSTVLECFWHSELTSQQRQKAGDWMSHEGWFAYAHGVIEHDEGLFDKIQEEPVT
jgi:hypothetical protein